MNKSKKPFGATFTTEPAELYGTGAGFGNDLSTSDAVQSRGRAWMLTESLVILITVCPVGKISQVKQASCENPVGTVSEARIENGDGPTEITA